MNVPRNEISSRGILMGWFLAAVVGLCFIPSVSAQDFTPDSLKLTDLKEVVVINPATTVNHQKLRKPLSTLDEFLEASQSINMIKRGAYAWEPTMNSMSSERLSVTIDGMQIFGACTDKMDPITSYIDVSNLSEAQISSGQQGAAFGNTIGGGINLVLDKSNFKSDGWKGTVESSFETNNQLRVVGAEADYSNAKFYVNTDLMFRKADNYYSGGRKEVLYSQFEKYNVSVNSGVKLTENQSLHSTLIYDEANDVGYPALTMDVSLARAVIASLSFNQDTLGRLTNWESKVYFNQIKHVMDDTKRENVAIHMDMPGWSETIGFYSQARYKTGRNNLFFKADGFYNKSLAEMTMYPTNSAEPLMFMLTWPDIRTTDFGFYAEDYIDFERSSLKLSTRIAYHSNEVADEFGLNSLKIFYPQMDATQTRLVKSFSAQYHQQFGVFHLNGGLSYGERAPSVSEGYGFYLFNSFDNHDYIGNPELHTEQSAEANVSLMVMKDNWEVTGSANYFRISNFVIGKVDSALSTMTIGADGVKIYANLDYAELTNISLAAKYKLTPAFKLSGLVSYHRGIDQDGGNLPIISPVSYRSAIDFNKNYYSGSVGLTGAAKQTNYNASYGESPTSAYATVNASLGKRFAFDSNTLFTKIGVENMFDTSYSTYTDWNKIPRMGRNFYITISYSIN